MLSAISPKTIEIIAQTIGYGATATTVVAYAMKHKKVLLALKLIAEFLWIVHFVTMNFAHPGALTGAMLNIVAFAREIVYYNSEKHRWARHPAWAAAAIALSAGTLLFTWESYFSVFPVIGMTFESISLILKDTVKMRILLLFSPVFWATYAICVGSWSSAATNMLCFVVIFGALIADIRSRRKAAAAVAAASAGNAESSAESTADDKTK